MGAQVSRFLPAARRPTYYFLQYAKRFSPVFMSCEIDMEAVVAHRTALRARGEAVPSYLSYVVRAVARVMTLRPEANASVLHSLFPRFRRGPRIHAKVAMDKVVAGERVTVPGLLHDCDRLTLTEIHARLQQLKSAGVESTPEFRNARILQRLPLAIGQWVYSAALSNLRRREELQGTFTISSLGQRPIRSFFPISSSTLCFGMGRVEARAVVRDGAVAARDVLELSLAFDHAALDGALAADVLSDVKGELESRVELENEIRTPVLAGQSPST